MTATTRMTVAQALVEFLANQWTVDGDHRERTVPGVFGIFGHGNVAGIGQALKQLHVERPGLMPYYQARNEQAMVHQSVGYARMHRRLGTFASAASVGPGAANMLTGAALATANRLPALLLPSDTFATRVADPVLQQLEHPHDIGIQVSDAFRPLSRFFDRVQRPEQLYSIALAAMRVLTDPAETGAVTIALPEDVQAEAVDVPLEFLAPREWHLRRPLPERGPLERAVAAIRSASAPIIVAGGGVIYSGAEEALARFASATGIPVGTSQAGGGSLVWDHAQNLGGIGATGTTAANRIAAEADVVIGIGTRYSDFTTASRTVFQRDDVTFVNLNVAAFDAYKHGTQLPVIADAREGIEALTAPLEGWSVDADYASRIAREKAEWDAAVDAAFAPSGLALPGQPELIGAIQAASAPRDVIVQAAGSLPGDLHKLWRVRDALGYHVEYAFSCMGYEIAGGLGVKRGAEAADDDRDVIVMVGDGSYLMLHTELVTAVAEGIKIIVVIVQNHGYASIGHLSETVGSERFGTKYRALDPQTLDFQGDQLLPIDLAANARSYGVDVIEVAPGPEAIRDLGAAVVAAKASTTSTVIHITSDPLIYAPDGGGWWDVPVAEVSELESTRVARGEYVEQRERQRPLLGSADEGRGARVSAVGAGAVAGAPQRRPAVAGAPLRRPAVAGAPVSFGVFELTPEGAETVSADELLDALGASDYSGVDLGPLGFLGEGAELRRRLDSRGLGLAGGWVQLPFSDDDAFASSLPQLDAAIRVFAEAAEAQPERAPLPTLADDGSAMRASAPGRGAEVDPLADDRWERLARNVAVAAERIRSAGLEPTFHHHAGTFVESPEEIDRFLALSDVDLTLDTGHLAIAGGDPVLAVERWGDRINHVHVKDVDRAELARVLAAGGGMREVWSSGSFVAFGRGDLDLTAVLDALDARGFDGWIVVEQDVLNGPEVAIEKFLLERTADQQTNRDALRRWA